MKTAITLKDTKGKTVETSIHSWSGGVLISFADDTFVVLAAIKKYYEEDFVVTDVEFNLHDFEEKDLVDAHIFSTQELADAKESILDRNKTLAEVAERAAYERLKVKYEAK